VVISRAEIYWADLRPPSGRRRAKRRPVLVIQSDPYNASRLATVLAAVITSNTALATNARQRVLARDHNETAT
jgi:mRNA interferase MazF